MTVDLESTVASYEISISIHGDDDRNRWCVVTDHNYYENPLGRITEGFHTYVIEEVDYTDGVECCGECTQDIYIFECHSNDLDEAINNHNIVLIMLRAGEI